MTRLDIEELWKQLMNVSKNKYQRNKKKHNIPVQLTKESRDFSRQKSTVWDPGRLETTTRKQQSSKVNGEQQHKVWDPRGFQQLEIMIRRSWTLFFLGSLMREHPASKIKHLLLNQGVLGLFEFNCVIDENSYVWRNSRKLVLVVECIVIELVLESCEDLERY